jgi:tRNA-Thr(GGU) m(6)t(6)A37 methyltransferase TsaA
MRFRPIGVLRTPFTEPARTPIQPVYAAGVAGRAELLPEYAEGLDDLDGFSHVWLLYVFHRAGAPRLRVKPYLQDVERGVFATRAPCRPNPTGLSLVRLVGRDGCVLHVEDVDMLDGSPLLDVKPFIPRFDVHEGARAGWQNEVDDETARRRGARLEAGQEPTVSEGGG